MRFSEKHFNFIHIKFNKALIILFILVIFLNLLDIHSTYLVITSGKGEELNNKYQEVNKLNFSRAFEDKLNSFLIMFISLSIFIFSTEVIFYINNKYKHFLDLAIHHFTWFMKYLVINIMGLLNLNYLIIVLINYYNWLI
jgi:hypothetical protein